MPGAILPRHALLGLLDREIINRDARFARQLDLRPLQNELLQRFPRQQLLWRLRPALAGHLALQARQTQAHFVVRHRLGVDHRHDEVGLPGSQGGCRRGRLRCRSGRWWFAADTHSGCAGGAHPLRTCALGDKRGQTHQAKGQET